MKRMCEECNQKNPNVPPNAENVLFAEDLVNYALLQFVQPYLSTGIADYRPLIYNAFNETVRVATNFIFRRLQRENEQDYEIITKENPLNKDSLMNYVSTMKDRYLSMGFNAQKLMHFCVKTATTAARFYSDGFDEGPRLAMESIVDVLDEFDMSSGGWDSLNVIAANYARIYNDLDNLLTPDSSSDFETASESSLESIECPEVFLVSDSTIQEACDGDRGPENAQIFHDSIAECQSSIVLEDYFTKQVQSSAIPPVQDTKVGMQCEGKELFCPLNATEKASSTANTPSSEKGCDCELNKVLNIKVSNVLPDLGLTSSPSNLCLEASCSGNSSTKELNEGFTKIDNAEEQEVKHSNSGEFMETAESLTTDVFDESTQVSKHFDHFGRQAAIKRPASSSSSTDGSNYDDSAQISAGMEQNVPASKSGNDESSPKTDASSFLKHVSKTRRI